MVEKVPDHNKHCNRSVLHDTYQGGLNLVRRQVFSAYIILFLKYAFH